MEICAAAGDIKIKSDGDKFRLFIKDAEIESSDNYNTVAKLATDIHASRVRTGDELIGKKMFAPSAIGEGGTVVVIAKTEHGYLVQRSGSDMRFEVKPEHLSEPPATYFN